VSTPLSPRTLVEYEGVLRVAFDGTEIDQSRVAAWSGSRRNVLRAALRRAGHRELAAAVPRSRRPRADLDVPVEAELRRIEKAAWALEPGPRAMVLLPLALGLRAREALELRRKDVERALDVGELKLTRKGGYEARIPCAHAALLFRQLLSTTGKRGQEWKRAGEVLSPEGALHTQYCALRRFVRRVGRAAGVASLRPHLLRHAFATRLVRDGASLAVVQRWLGHSSLATTQRYLHPEAADLQRYARPVRAPQ
jgi:integrase